jgi:hypothetical protein
MRLFFVLLLGCSSSTAPTLEPADSAVAADATDVAIAAETTDVAVDANKAAACASTFGDALTNAFGRADGTVVAIVGPKDTQCAMPNSDHVVVQISMGAKVYRMVVNVQSTRGDDRRVRFATIEHALLGEPWAEGWHIGIPVDYPTMLDAHVAAFTPYEMDPLVAKVTDAITIGSKVSVFATSSGGASAHNVHRNSATNSDGAIVLDPTGPKPKWLLFHFSDQTF